MTDDRFEPLGSVGRTIPEYEREFLLKSEREMDSLKDEPKATVSESQLCGLSLSGGGIRSATFNLGLLQGLEQLGLLQVFDYVATVSGGGYIGGFWTAWRYREQLKRESQTCGKADDAKHRRSHHFPEGQRGARGANLRAVRHLREFSNFLTPRLGLLSPDTGRALTALLGAIIPSLLAALSFIVLTISLWLVLAKLTVGSWVTPPLVPTWWNPGSSGAIMLGLTLVTLAALERRQVIEDDAIQANRTGASGNPVRRPWKVLGYFLPVLLLSVLVVLAFWQLYRLAPTRATEWMTAGNGYFAPAITWAATSLFLVIARWFGSRFPAEWARWMLMSATERCISRLMLLATTWATLAALWLCTLAAHEWNSSDSLAGDYWALYILGMSALGAIFARVQKLLLLVKSQPTTPGITNRLRRWVPQALAYLMVSLFIIGLMSAFQHFKIGIESASGDRALGYLVLVALGITALTLLFFDPNETGLHSFYRGRLGRAFLGASHGEAPGESEAHEGDDIALHQLNLTSRPMHLICCSANDLFSKDHRENLYRGADSAVLSWAGFSVGSEARSWREIQAQSGRVPSLASAMTASGAALNSHMGRISMRLGPAVTFLMTAFNMRLGLWWPHPTRQTKKQWFLRLLVGLPFYKELLGLSRAKGRDVLLSDGGHFENLALYELVRRHCRFILVSDCGMDKDAAFDDFANAVRRVREDFGAEIRIDLSPLRPGPDGRSRQAIVAGDIEYPDGDTGVLLLVKPSLVGIEPADVLQYRTRNEYFPHESTTDQFFDEAQWEAYRRLGEHVALASFRSLQEEWGETPPTAAQLFVRARYEWLPVPEGYKERFSRYIERASELDLLLQQPKFRQLFREIFKEVTEIDSQARKHFGRRWRWFRHNSSRIAPTPSPSPSDLTDALYLLRRALLLMEDVFHSEDLANHYSHPGFIGTINYFARWAYSPIFRMWWPLLKPLYSPRFTHFLESRFHLPSLERERMGRLSDGQGYAMACWRLEGGRQTRDIDIEKRKPGPGGERLISYELALPYVKEPQFFIQAAQLILRIGDDEGRPYLWDADGYSRRVAAWQERDFYVPPGLWGSGIGEVFLKLVTSDFWMKCHLEPGSLLAVRLLVDRDAPPARRQRWADGVQMYRAHGFAEPEESLRTWLTESIGPKLVTTVPTPVKDTGTSLVPYWMVRTYRPEGVPRRCPDPVGRIGQFVRRHRRRKR